MADQRCSDRGPEYGEALFAEHAMDSRALALFCRFRDVSDRGPHLDYLADALFTGPEAPTAGGQRGGEILRGEFRDGNEFVVLPYGEDEAPAIEDIGLVIGDNRLSEAGDVADGRCRDDRGQPEWHRLSHSPGFLSHGRRVNRLPCDRCTLLGRAIHPQIATALRALGAF